MKHVACEVGKCYSLKVVSPFSRDNKIWILVLILGSWSFDFLANLELSFSLFIMIWLWSFLVAFINVNFATSLSLDPTDLSVDQDSTEDSLMAIDHDMEASSGDCALDPLLNDSVGTYRSENEVNLGILRRQFCSSTINGKKRYRGTSRSRGWSPALSNKKQQPPSPRPRPSLDRICHDEEFLATCTGPEVPTIQESGDVLLLVLNCISGSS